MLSLLFLQQILGRTIRVDHVQEYKIPKEHKNDDELVIKMREEGCAPTIQPSSDSDEEELLKDFVMINKKGLLIYKYSGCKDFHKALYPKESKS